MGPKAAKNIIPLRSDAPESRLGTGFSTNNTRGETRLTKPPVMSGLFSVWSEHRMRIYFGLPCLSFTRVSAFGIASSVFPGTNNKREISEGCVMVVGGYTDFRESFSRSARLLSSSRMTYPRSCLGPGRHHGSPSRTVQGLPCARPFPHWLIQVFTSRVGFCACVVFCFFFPPSGLDAG